MSRSARLVRPASVRGAGRGVGRGVGSRSRMGRAVAPPSANRLLIAVSGDAGYGVVGGVGAGAGDLGCCR